MIPDDDLDPMAELLGGVRMPPVDLALRDAIFTQTCGILWQRRWGRRGAWVTAFAACFVCGVMTGRVWTATPANNQATALPGQNVDASAPDSAVRPEDVPGTLPSSEALRPAQAQPVRSSDAPQTVVAKTVPSTLTTFEKLRRAGDRQLNERGNLQAAIGCYRRALDCASDNELEIVPERDSWLLIPLKEARLEAGKHVQKKS